MPRLLDSIALSLALSACSPLAVKSGPNGTHARTPDQFQLTVLSTPSASVAAPAVAPVPPAIPDGFECKSVQNEVKKDITRCCLTIAPHKACREMGATESEKFSKDNVIDFGEKKVPNFASIKGWVSGTGAAQETGATAQDNGISPEMYMKYLVQAAKNAADLAATLTAFVKYQTINDDSLLTASEIVSRGTGDCDNVANLFVELLEKLGKKQGIDYKAKVIGLDGANHAVAVFLDTDGKWKSLDFSLPFNELRQSDGHPDLFSASTVFEKQKGKSNKFFARKKLGATAGSGARIDHIIDPETMMPNGKELALAVGFDYSPSINPDVFLKDYNWRQMDLTHIHYQNETTAYYRKGVFFQLTDESKFTIYNEKNIVTEIQYKKHPTIKYEYFTETGILERRDYKNGKSEVYLNGVLFQLTYSTGPLEYEVFHESGAIRQKNYRDGKTEWFDENGKITHRKDKKGKVTVFKAEGAVANL